MSSCCASMLFLQLMVIFLSTSYAFTFAFTTPCSRRSQHTVNFSTSTIPETTDPSSLSSPMERVGINSRGAKMNEIDFTLAPSDVSLSRCYQMSRDGSPAESASETQEQRVQTLSLTRALNTASNRAVRRILLARSWPSAEALNLSLRTVLMQQPQSSPLQEEMNGDKEDKAKCPVPRPILNILMNRREGDSSPSINGNSSSSNPTPRTGQDKEKQWVKTQLAAFKESYQNIRGYDAAEAYLECILSLATVGIESDRVTEVIEGGVYAEAYRRILSVIQSVGAVLETLPGSNKKKIASKLTDIDFCLSMLDKIALKNEKAVEQLKDDTAKKSTAVEYDAAARLAYEADSASMLSMPFEEFKEIYVRETVSMVSTKKLERDQVNVARVAANKATSNEDEPKGAHEKGRKRRLLSSFRKKDDVVNSKPSDARERADADTSTSQIQPDDLGGVLLSAEEPTMTRQLNILSNIVQRTLIFGGDQELLVLSETLVADRPAFIKRWYNDDTAYLDIEVETRPGVLYLNALIQLLRDCYSKGVVNDVNPKLPLTSGYKNAYGRLIASLVELGSGYVRPTPTSLPISLALSAPAATAKYLTATNPPKSPREELGRFAAWEKAVRKDRISPYPDDLVGSWDVQDIVGGSIIGTTRVTFQPAGEVVVKPPMQGLRWRLDPGPTHLDTCTFQVLSDDGAILQYKGFVDRGSRLEARISKRSVSMRGGVSFLMRDAELGAGAMNEEYWDDMLPMNFNGGMTKFTMSRIVEEDRTLSN
eukprot:scaffold38787_cov73-Cyclotella_meneghiniana.AAC.2